MSEPSARLKPPRKTLRGRHELSQRLLRTALATAIITASGLYLLNDTLRSPRINPAQRPSPPAGTAAAPALSPPAVASAALTDPLALIKHSKAAEEYGAAPRKAEPPRLKAVTFAGSGGNFSALGQKAREQETARTGSALRDQEAVLLPAYALKKAVRVKGAGPVPASIGKKYSGVDPEAESLRERLRRQAEADKTGKARLRDEKLLLIGWLILLVLAAMLIPSRLIKAWRLIHKPEDSHWTLR